ncbi:MAG TPA: TonB-dependent receptor, partial [Novosphingobium sp.]|nr:TonB-dependent receptor [Novosphingobium sp.]
NPVTSDTTLSAAQLAAANSTRTLLKNSDQVQHYGLLRHTQHAHGVLDYTFSPHISAQVLAGYNHETWSNIIDLDGQDSAAGSFNWPYEIDDKQRDWSVEGRLNYTYGKLHGVVGASYLSAQGQQALATLGGTYTASGPSTTKTFGAFFGATYDVTSKLSASFEGRYQIDTIGAYFGGGKTYTDSLGYLPAGTYASGSLIGQKSFNNFLPRIIVNYQINPSLMVYASWSKGVNPSTYNSYVMALSTTLQGLAKSSGVPLFANPEKVTNYEIGAKGKLLNGRLRYSGALYYAQWTDQVNAQQVGYYQSTDGSVVSTTQSTATPLYNFYNAYLNTGAVDMYGVELNGTYKMNDLITIDAGGAMNASRIINYKDSSLTALYGITNFYGKEMPHTSKYSANVGVTFGGDVKGYANATWFLRGDWNFKSGMWSDQANVTRTRDLHLFNARLGGTMGRYSASLFMNNIFNNHTAVSINNNYAINSYSGYFSALSAVQVGLPDLRTFGVQLKVKI